LINNADQHSGDRHGWYRLVVGGGWVLVVGCVAALVFGPDKRLLSLGLNTVGFAAGAAGVALPLGTLLALILNRTPAFGRRVARWLIVGLLFLPVYFHAAAWSSGFGKLVGRDFLITFVSSDEHVRWLSAMWIQGLSATAWVVLILSAGLQLVEPELEEDASLAGGWWNVIFHVTLPRCRATWLVALWWVLVLSASDMTVSNLYQIRTLA